MWLNVTFSPSLPILAARWVNARTESKFYIAELAKLTGMAENTLSKIENGHVTSPNLSSIKKVSAVLNKPIWYLGGFDLLPDDSFAARLKKARLYAGLTKRDFAKLFSIDGHTVAFWEESQKKPSKQIKIDLNKFINNYLPKK